MKKQKILLPTYLYSPSRNPGPGRCPLKKWIKRDVSNFLKTKKKQKISPPTHLEPKSRSRKVFPKEEKKKERYAIPKTKKNKKSPPPNSNLLL
jgi:hypothetical protein